MKSWVHCIGRSFYDKRQFIVEATGSGASRRVSWKLMKHFQYGDRVYVAESDFRSSKRKSPFNGSFVFGYFTITQVLVDQPTAATLAAACGSTLTPIAPSHVVRNCGKYDIVSKFLVPTTTSIADMALVLSQSKGPSTPLVLIGGPFTELHNEWHLPDLGFAWGYRRLSDSLVATASQLANLPKGQYHSFPGNHIVDIYTPDPNTTAQLQGSKTAAPAAKQSKKKAQTFAEVLAISGYTTNW